MKHFVILIALVANISLCAQVQVNLASIAEKISATNCLSINISNQTDIELDLHGQNYRLYYDASKLELVESSVVSFLPNDSYSDAIVKQDISNVDASGFGALPFESNLGFVNFYIDYKNQVGGAQHITSGAQLNIAQLCFDGEALSAENIVWASREYTATYATAFNEMKILQSETKTPMSDSEIIYSSNFGDESTTEPTVNDIDLDYYPNPFSDRLTLALNQALTEKATVQVYDLFGQLVREYSLEIGAVELAVDGAELLSGAYLIRLSTPSGYTKEVRALRIR